MDNIENEPRQDDFELPRLAQAKSQRTKTRTRTAETSTPTRKVKSPLRDKNFSGPIVSPPRDSEAGKPVRPTRDTLTYSDYLRLERQYADSVIQNKDLIHEQERVNGELDEKSRQLEAKTQRLNELLQDNTALMNQLRKERELNEQEFNSWADLKAQLESKVRRLDETLQETQEDCESLEMERTNSVVQYNEVIDKHKQETEKLQKRVTILAKENELEVHSKMMIIDELEMFKEKWAELDQKYHDLKGNYDSIVDQFSNSVDDIDVANLTTGSSAGKSEQTDTADSSDRRIKVAKRGSRSSMASSIEQRRNSLNKFIKDVELQAQAQKHSQETIKLKFQIKSLELQNEKLHSYIGFVLQQIENPQDTGTYEYGDEANIKTAKKNLKSVIHSASALPMRPAADTAPAATGRQRSVMGLRRRSGDGYVNASSTEQLISDASSDYEGGDVENLDIGDMDDYSYATADDDLEDVLNEEELDEYGDAEEGDDSMDVSFAVNLKPFGMRKRRQSKQALKSSPRRHLKKLSSFSLNVRSSLKNLQKHYSDLTLSQKGSSKSIRQRNSNADVRARTSNLDLRPRSLQMNMRRPSSLSDIKKSPTPRVLRQHFSNLDLINEVSETDHMFYPLVEEEGSRFDDSFMDDLNETGFVDAISENDDDDDHDDEEETEDAGFIDSDINDNTIGISTDEIDRFKIVVLRNLFCPRHMRFHCFCRDTRLVNTADIQSAILPGAVLQRQREVEAQAEADQGETTDGGVLDESDLDIVD